MINQNMHWTDIYEVKYSVGIIKMYISSYKDGSFLGTVLYDESLTTGNTVPSWTLKQFPEKSEAEAYQSCDDFVNEILESKGGCEINKILRKT